MASLGLGDIFTAIDELVARNATHLSSGVCMADAMPVTAVGHLADEVDELYEAVVLHHIGDGDGSITDEIGDVLGVLCHLMRLYKVEPETAIAACLEKFKVRFD